MAERTQNRLLNDLERNVQEDGSVLHTAMRDVLTDLMHIAKKEGFDFGTLLRNAEEVFDQE